MAQMGQNMAAVEAAGARGGPCNRTPAREWYTVVVYEKPHVKKAVLYVGREAFVFNIPADINVGNIAVLLKRWRVGGRTVAYSASIHVANLAKLLDAYAREEAERAGVLERVLSAAVAAHADGVLCRGTP